MPSFDSLQLITSLQNQTEYFLEKVINEWQMMPSDMMLKQPENKWSAAQCLEHLNSYGRYYLPALHQSIENAFQKKWQFQPIFQPSWLGNYFTNLMLPKGSTHKISKMKSPKNHIPVANLDWHTVVAEFIQQQKTVLALLGKAKSIDLRKAKTPVSISRFIKLPVGDTFRFVIAHNYRHVLQAERALSTYNNTIKNYNI